jgi:hypothetical protein
MGLIYVAFAIVAASFGAYWYFAWRMVRRWNELLRRSGKTPDGDIMGKTFKLLDFMWSDQHAAFGDAKLSRLVARTRGAFGIASAGLLLWIVTLAVVPYLSR